MRPKHLFSAYIHDSAQPYVPMSVPGRIDYSQEVFAKLVEDITEHQTIVLVRFSTSCSNFGREIIVRTLDLRACLMGRLHDRGLGHILVCQGPGGKVGFKRGGHSLAS